MRSSFFALVATLVLAAACNDAPQTSTAAKPATTPGVGSPVSASGKARIALLLSLIHI